MKLYKSDSLYFLSDGKNENISGMFIWTYIAAYRYKKQLVNTGLVAIKEEQDAAHFAVEFTLEA